jgi:hypothetical protein
MTDPAFAATYRTLSGTDIRVEARRGTQLISPISGTPLPVTDYGTVTITVGSADPVTFTQHDDLAAVHNLLKQADNVADMRDEIVDEH